MRQLNVLTKDFELIPLQYKMEEKSDYKHAIAAIKEELKRRNPRNFHACKTCLYKTRSLSAILKHVRRHRTAHLRKLFNCFTNEPEMYSCLVCDFKSQLLVNYNKHIIASHKRLPKAETEKFYLPKRAKSSSMDTSENYSCDRCSYKTHSQLMYVTHYGPCIMTKNIKKEPILECSECFFKTKYKSSLKQHQLYKHTAPEDLELLKCPQCRFKTIYNGTLRNHIQTKHIKLEDIVWFKCDQCSYKTKWKNHLKDHIILKHTTPVQWLGCVSCPHKTKRKADLKAHIVAKHLSPTKIQWFYCDQCAYKTKRKSYLSTHEKAKHALAQDVEWFKCKYCAYITKWGGYLKKHQAKHEAGKLCNNKK